MVWSELAGRVLAQAGGSGAAAAPNPLLSLGPIVLMLVIMYLLVIRPQNKRAKEHRELITRLKSGDRVVTSGGIHGTVTAVRDHTLMVRIAEGVEIELLRSAVGTVAGSEDSK